MKLRDFQSSWSIGRRFWPHVRRYRGSLLLVGLLSLALAVFHVLQPWPLKWIVDGALAPETEPDHSWDFYVWTGAVGYLALVAGQSLLEYVSTVKAAEVGHLFVRTLRRDLFEHLSRLSPLFHARNKTGDILVRLMGDIALLRAMLIDASTELLTRSLWVAGTLVVMFLVDAYMTLILLAILPLIAWVVAAVASRIRVAVNKQRRKESVLADFLHEAIAATETIQSLGRSEAVVRSFARDNRRSERAGLKAARLAARLAASVQTMLGLGIAVTLVIGSHRVQQGHLQLGELLVFISYVRGVLKPVRSASRNSAKIAKGAACGQRILEILDEPVMIKSPADSLPAPVRPQRLVFDDVSFAYDGREALRGFDTEFRRGELTGVFGRSGAGKSTVAALAVRLYDPDRGAVRIDETDLRDLDLQSLRESFGLCLQRSELFGDSVRENLLLGAPEASDGELLEACRRAGALGFLEQLPEGLDTVLGAAGAGLSGGQRRRLGLARTLLRRAPILIVDEPFAGLDRESVTRVMETLRAVARTAIVVVIAHDAEFLAGYDRVVFIDRGRVVASGRHEDLLEAEPAYRGVLELTPEEVS